MKNHQASMQFERDRPRRLSASLVPPGRWSLALALIAGLLVSALGPPAPARADPPPDPAARLQFIIHKIHIIDDTDFFGGGEEFLFVLLCGDTGTSPYNRSFACGAGASSAFESTYDLSSGDETSPERVSPREGDYMEGGTTPEGGIPVYAGQHYVFTSDMFDRDPAYTFDTMGDIFVHVDQENNWGIGTFTTSSTQEDGSPGDYNITYEIRRAPLPELVNRGIHIINGNDGQFYCVTVANVGEQPSPSVSLTVRADGVLVQTVDLGPIDVDQSTGQCVLRSQLPARQHQLSFMVDEARQIPEMDETDNYYEWKIPAVAAAGAAPAGTDAGATLAGPDAGAAPSPEPKPSGSPTDPDKGQPDLTVRAIRVNGQAPDGKDDCKPGHSNVAVIVKKAGKGDAGSFIVRLSVDGNTLDSTVDGLTAGQEREVRFDDVPLKTGTHALTAAADPEHAIGESKDTNNELKVSARCNGGQ